MAHIEGGHKLLHIFEHIWPYVTGVFAVIIGGLKLWWSDKQKTKKRISNIEYITQWLKENSITSDDLKACREEVREVDDKNLEVIFDEIKTLRRDIRHDSKSNAEQHQDILKQIIKLHGDMKR